MKSYARLLADAVAEALIYCSVPQDGHDGERYLDVQLNQRRVMRLRSLTLKLADPRKLVVRSLREKPDWFRART